MYEWDWAGADAHFQAALKADPMYATAFQSYGVFLASMARHEEAERALTRALELDPLSLSAADSLGWFWYIRGNYERAASQYRQLLDLDPTFGQAHRFLGLVKLRQGDHAGARAALEKAASLLGSSTEPEVDLAVAFAVAGETGRARRALDGLLQARQEGRYVAAVLLAGLFESLGRRPEALDELERAERERTSTLVLVGIDPLFASLRAEPRLQRLMARIGLPGSAG
jgi:tetratricopeptide (TPR) repeat protein